MNITIPSGIVPPKFHLFQRVQVKGHVGTIVGMSYTSEVVALQKSLRIGWDYEVEFDRWQSGKWIGSTGDLSDWRQGDEVEEIELIDESAPVEPPKHLTSAS